VSKFYKFVRVMEDGRRVSSFASVGLDPSIRKNTGNCESHKFREYRPGRFTSDVSGGGGIWLMQGSRDKYEVKYRFGFTHSPTDCFIIGGFSGISEIYEVIIPKNAKMRRYGPSVIRLGKLVMRINTSTRERID
jgi:hypothetical protein